MPARTLTGEPEVLEAMRTFRIRAKPCSRQKERNRSSLSSSATADGLIYLVSLQHRPGTSYAGSRASQPEGIGVVLWYQAFSSHGRRSQSSSRNRAYFACPRGRAKPGGRGTRRTRRRRLRPEDFAPKGSCDDYSKNFFTNILASGRASGAMVSSSLSSRTSVYRCPNSCLASAMGWR